MLDQSPAAGLNHIQSFRQQWNFRSGILRVEPTTCVQRLYLRSRFARDLDIPVRIAGIPTVREPDGLALSSRNAYLSPEERRIAPVLSRVLLSIAAALTQEPTTAARELARGFAELETAGFEVEYLEIREAAALTAVMGKVTAPSRILAAVHLGRTRLIDNVPIPIPPARP